jgi:hypothetical protein
MNRIFSLIFMLFLTNCILNSEVLIKGNEIGGYEICIDSTNKKTSILFLDNKYLHKDVAKLV